MAQLGADVDALRRCGKLFAAVRLERSAGSLTAASRVTAWTGPDADRFRAELSATHAPQLRRVGSTLRGLGRDLERQANQQERASAGGDVAVASVDDGWARTARDRHEAAWRDLYDVDEDGEIEPHEIAAVNRANLLKDLFGLDTPISLLHSGEGSP